MATFQQLQERVAGYLIDTPAFTSGLVPSWINKAIRDAEDRHNYRHMERVFEATTVAGERVLAARPADWKMAREAPYLLHDDGETKELGWAASREQMRRQFGEDNPQDAAEPRFIMDDAEDGLLVYPLSDSDSDYSDGEYRVRVPYWGYSPALTGGSSTNWWTDNREWYLVFYAAAEGFLANRDTQEATVYLERAEVERQKSVRTNKQQANKPPRVLVPRRGVYGLGRQPPRR